jgi:hypothetical protein
MAGDVACACAFVCYAGPFNADFRMLLLKERFYKDCVDKKIPVSPNVDVAKFMVDENTIGGWAREGLPRDELSIQNGIMVTRASKWPLLIDPQGQGLGWIKRRDEVNRLRITELTEKRFRNALEDSMAFGEPLLIQNVEEVLDPILDPVLDKLIQRSGRGWKACRLGRQGVSVHGDVPHVHDHSHDQPGLLAGAARAGGLDQLHRDHGWPRAAAAQSRRDGGAAGARGAAAAARRGSDDQPEDLLIRALRRGPRPAWCAGVRHGRARPPASSHRARSHVSAIDENRSTLSTRLNFSHMVERRATIETT